MGIFSKKEQVGLYDFCTKFYDENVFFLKQGFGEIGNVYCQEIKTQLDSEDEVFLNIEEEKFNDEILNLRLEIIALAWTHHVDEETSIGQSRFTEEYLVRRDKKSVWDAMEYYNKAISSSTTYGISDSQKGGVIKKRMDTMDKYIKILEEGGVDVDDQIESISRAINRFFSEKSWKKDVTSHFLMLAFCHKLNLGSGPDYMGPNQEAQFLLRAVIHGFYKGAAESIENKVFI